jgi:hypothetical protein
MRMGNSFVQDETRRAVETELGRGFRAGLGEEVVDAGIGGGIYDDRKRMGIWKATVVRRQRITVFGRKVRDR